MPTVHYPRNAAYPPMKRKKSGCSCDGIYARSLQGICKVISLLIGCLAFIIIAASPYWRPLFVLEGETWPFHVVMLVTILAWLATITMYILFLSGQHLQYPHINWPKVELQFNVAMVLMSLFAAILEAANVWRWDMSRGLSGGLNSGFNSNGMNNQLTGYGYRPGMTFSQSMNFNSYCTRYPNECRDYFSLLTGNNSYFGNHIFATILLFFLVASYLASLFFAYRTWKVFKRDMHKERDPNAPLPPPSAWERFRFRLSEIKMPTAGGMRDRFTRVFSRDDPEDAAPANDVDVETGTLSKKDTIPYVDEAKSSIVKPPPYPESSVYSDGHKSRKSRNGSSNGRRSRSSEPRKHRDRDSDRGRDRDSSYHGSSRDEKRSDWSHGSEKRSRRSGSKSRSSHKNDRKRSDRKDNRHDDAEEPMIAANGGRNAADGTAAPVASFVI